MRRKMTFDFPIYMSFERKLDALFFDVWDKDVFRKDRMGWYTLLVDQWLEGTAFAFDNCNNQPFFVDLVSSRTTTTVPGTMCIKVGFIHPPTQRVRPTSRKPTIH
ncbi:hypothetical protein EDB86DRAFT_2965585 [Lactarius hatsudake]|nr:hypothetical protein EDB86DRAFT_2965585 [Lactarius hatsudake]